MLKEYARRRIVVTAEKVDVGTTVHNFLENEDYVSTEDLCIKLTGTVKEMWLVTVPELVSTYSYPNGKAIRKNELPEGEFKVRLSVRRSEKTIFAEQTKQKLKIRNKFGNVIEANRRGIPHGSGDYIIYGNKDNIPDFEDRNVINGKIFLKLYREIKTE